jgi:hypothetical protein
MGIDSLLQSLAGGPGYALVGLFAFLESAALVGLVIPGETAMLLHLPGPAVGVISGRCAGPLLAGHRDLSA